MVDFNIKKLIKLFDTNYTIRINDTVKFVKLARFLTIQIDVINNIIANYKAYLLTTGFECKLPEEFLEDKMYLVDFACEIERYNARKDRKNYLHKNNFDELAEYFEFNLKQKFADNYKRYDNYIPEAKHLFIFEPNIKKDNMTGEFKVSEKTCKVIPPYPIYQKGFFNHPIIIIS